MLRISLEYYHKGRSLSVREEGKELVHVPINDIKNGKFTEFILKIVEAERDYEDLCEEVRNYARKTFHTNFKPKPKDD